MCLVCVVKTILYVIWGSILILGIIKYLIVLNNNLKLIMSSSTELITLQPTINNNTYHKIEARIITNLKSKHSLSDFKSGKQLLKYMVLLTNAVSLPKNATIIETKKLSIESGSGSEKMMVTLNVNGANKLYFVKKYNKVGNEKFFANFNKNKIDQNNGKLYKLTCVGEECCFLNNRVLQELIVNFVMKNLNILYQDINYKYNNIHTYEFINMDNDVLNIYQSPIGIMINGDIRTTMEDILSIIEKNIVHFANTTGYNAIDNFFTSIFEIFIMSYKELATLLDYKHGDMHSGNIFIKPKIAGFTLNGDIFTPSDLNVLSEQIVLLHSDFDLARINVGNTSFMPDFKSVVAKTNITTIIEPIGKYIRTTCKFKTIKTKKTKKNSKQPLQRSKNSTTESQLLVHLKGAQVMASRSSIGVNDKSAPHGSVTNSNASDNITKNVNNYIYEMFDILCMYVSILLFAKKMNMPYVKLLNVKKLFERELIASYMHFKPNEITELLIKCIETPSIKKTILHKSKIIPLTDAIGQLKYLLLTPKFNIPHHPTDYM